MSERIACFVMSGGIGSRLWPLSREDNPKQFHDLSGDGSMLLKTVRRLKARPAGNAPVNLIASEKHAERIRADLAGVGLDGGSVIFEPVGRNTAPAVAVAALHALREDSDALVLVVPSDHDIATDDEFWRTVEDGVGAARDGRLVVFGVRPTQPETGYGYIEVAGEASGKAIPVARFVEKPDLATAAGKEICLPEQKEDVIDEDATGTCTDRDGNHRCRRLAFTYVYAEAELRLRPNVAVMLRPQYGRLTFDDRGDGQPDDCLQGELAAGCDVTHGGGVRARLRLGPETGTNLLLGAAFTSQVGTLLEAAYSWAPHPQVPVLLAVQVTDLPIPEDFGVRILGDVGWRKLAWVYPSLRLSYQARDVDHAGFSGGLGLNFDW